MDLSLHWFWGFSRNHNLISAPARGQVVMGFPEELKWNWIIELTPAATFFACCCSQLLNKQTDEANVMSDIGLWGLQTLVGV